MYWSEKKKYACVCVCVREGDTDRYGLFAKMRLAWNERGALRYLHADAACCMCVCWSQMEVWVSHFSYYSHRSCMRVCMYVPVLVLAFCMLHVTGMMQVIACHV